MKREQNIHPDDFQAIISKYSGNSGSCSESTASSPTLFGGKNTGKDHGWLDLIINGLFPFTSCKNEVLVGHIKHESICYNTLMDNIETFSSVVEQKIAVVLQGKFAVLFDGWTTDKTHYIAMFATFLWKNMNDYDSALLAMSIFEN